MKQKKTALVVDDERFSRSFAAQILSDEGFEVIEAKDAVDGLRELDRNDEVSLVVADMGTPGAGKSDALTKIVGSRRPDVALLLTSGYGNIGSGDIRGFVSKPYTAETLSKALREVVRH